jgi:hypothetical protein
MALTATDLARLRALPYHERHPRMPFPGEPHFTACTPCSELQRGDPTHNWTVAEHPCWATGGPCGCGCADVAPERRKGPS